MHDVKTKFKKKGEEKKRKKRNEKDNLPTRH